MLFITVIKIWVRVLHAIDNLYLLPRPMMATEWSYVSFLAPMNVRWQGSETRQLWRLFTNMLVVQPPAAIGCSQVNWASAILKWSEFRISYSPYSLVLDGKFCHLTIWYSWPRVILCSSGPFDISGQVCWSTSPYDGSYWLWWRLHHPHQTIQQVTKVKLGHCLVDSKCMCTSEPGSDHACISSLKFWLLTKFTRSRQATLKYHASYHMMYPSVLCVSQNMFIVLGWWF